MLVSKSSTAYGGSELTLVSTKGQRLFQLDDTISGKPSTISIEMNNGFKIRGNAKLEKIMASNANGRNSKASTMVDSENFKTGKMRSYLHQRLQNNQKQQTERGKTQTGMSQLRNASQKQLETKKKVVLSYFTRNQATATEKHIRASDYETQVASSDANQP